MEAIEGLRFLASLPLAGTGRTKGGEKTQPFNHFHSRLFTHSSIRIPNVYSTLWSVHAIMTIVHHCWSRCVTEEMDFFLWKKQSLNFVFGSNSLVIVFIVVDYDSRWYFKAHLWNWGKRVWPSFANGGPTQIQKIQPKEDFRIRTFVTLKWKYFSKPLHVLNNRTNQIASFDQPMKSDQSDCLFWSGSEHFGWLGLACYISSIFCVWSHQI